MVPETMDRGCLDSHPEVLDKDRLKLSTETTVEEVLRQWFKILEAYTLRSLTFEKDRLPAIAGVAKVFGRLTGYSYKAGLWDEDLIRGLAWSIHYDDGGHKYKYRQPGRTRCSAYVAPSWTWASIQSRLSLENGDEIKFESYFKAAEDITVLETRLEYLSDDTYLGVLSGLLKICGRCRPWKSKNDAGVPYFDCNSNDELNSHLHRCSTDDGANLLFLLLGKVEMFYFALILEETDLHGTYKRIGLWRVWHWDILFKDWTIKTLTII
jgi:hypothetical protein